MAEKEKLKLLQKWEEQYYAINDNDLMLNGIFGDTPPGSQLYKATWGVFEVYTNVLAVLLGDEDAEWLGWYCWENNMGERSLTAQAASWKRMRKIKNLSALLDLIEADK
jgi:hypothetical protein